MKEKEINIGGSYTLTRVGRQATTTTRHWLSDDNNSSSDDNNTSSGGNNLSSDGNNSSFSY